MYRVISFYAFGHGKNIRLICFIYKFGIYVDTDRHISFILVSFFYGLSNLPLLLQIISFLGKIRQLLWIHFYIIIQCDLICRFCKLFYAVQYLFYLCLVAGIKSNLNLIVSRYQIRKFGKWDLHFFESIKKLGYHFFILRRNIINTPVSPG